MKEKTHVHASWVLPLALLALPDCGFSGNTRFDIEPGTLLVPCDLPLETPSERRCASPSDIMLGVRLNEAAIALAQGNTGKYIGIDDSPAALARCGGAPEAVVFRGEFPAGMPVCIDPHLVGPGQDFATSTSVCVEKCLDLVDAGDPADPALLAFCQERARPSTNVPDDPDAFFGAGCTTAGMPNGAFADPRKSPEPIFWVKISGVVPSLTDLLRDSMCPATGCVFDSGAASLQVATSKDGYLEFSVSELDKNRIIGLTTGQGTDDTSYDFATIGFSIDFNSDGCFYVYEKGAPQIPPTQPMPPTCVLRENAFGTYATGDRFRISFKDNFDGTATITYGKLQGPCLPGSECPAPPFFVSAAHGAYPLHVDAAFQDQFGALLDIRLVYIH